MTQKLSNMAKISVQNALIRYQPLCGSSVVETWNISRLAMIILEVI